MAAGLPLAACAGQRIHHYSDPGCMCMRLRYQNGWAAVQLTVATGQRATSPLLAGSCLRQAPVGIQGCSGAHCGHTTPYVTRSQTVWLRGAPSQCCRFCHRAPKGRSVGAPHRPCRSRACALSMWPKCGAQKAPPRTAASQLLPAQDCRPPWRALRSRGGLRSGSAPRGSSVDGYMGCAASKSDPWALCQTGEPGRECSQPPHPARVGCR